MGAGASRAEQAKRRTMNIDQQLERDKSSSARQIKLLLLGAAESGKSTLVQQVRILYLGGFSEEERERFKTLVYENTLDGMSTIVSAMQLLGIAFEAPERTIDAGIVQDLVVGQIGALNRQDITQHVVFALKRLWADAGVRQCFARSNEYQLDDSLGYLLDSLDRIGAPDYVPSHSDVLRTRLATVGVDEVQFQVHGQSLCLYDVAGQRSERRKWIHHFDNVNAILFVVALSAYDQVLRENGVTNRLRESLTLYQAVRTTPFFLTTPTVVYLNKRDRFADKILRSPLQVCFAEYEGEQTYDSASDYIAERFKLISQDSNAPSYYHFTCAVDTDSVRVVFEATVDIVMRQSVTTLGMI